jgi:protoporphyrinogen oxidase
MTHKRVAILGGGIAGLTCLHELSRRGVDATLYEGDSRVGGRIKTFRDESSGNTIELGAGYFHQYYYGLRELIDELDLSSLIVARSKGGPAIVKDGESISITSRGILAAVLARKLGLRDALSLRWLKAYARAQCHGGYQAISRLYSDEEGLDVNAAIESNPWLARIHKEAFSVVTDRLTDNVRELFVRPLCRKQLFQDPEQMSHMLGATVLGSAGLQLQSLQGGLEMIPRRLHARYASRIHLDHPVRGVVRGSDGTLEILGRDGEGLPGYDLVVSAVPLSLMHGIYAPFSSLLEYSSTRIFVVRGKLYKQLDRGDSIFTRDLGAGIDGITRYAEHLFKVSARGATLDLSAFFESYEILTEQKWTHAVPIHSAGTSCQVHEPIDGIYFVGDYLFPCLEAAVVSAKVVARQITARIQGPN